MMEKLMVDSVVTWARQYKVDGFRFDLMGHHSKANMLRVRRALDALTPERDGVDGRRIYVYGEGWDFGEVAGDARFVQATQRNMAGTGIGTFSDRLRDAVRGGGPFDEDPRVQGFATGLLTDPNGAEVNGGPEEQRARLLNAHDLIKVGLAGNLRDFTFVGASGAVVRGDEVLYNGQPAGYAADPSETITYVDAHDNETLFDVLQHKLPRGTSMADRVRMNTVALATTAFAQSPSFWHAGTDLLRSKSLDRNSYDSGDWFNRIDWTATESTWGSGLPPAEDNASKWDFMRPLLEDPALRPQAADIRAARDRAAELLRIRSSTPLLRLGSARLIQERVAFPTGGPSQTPGVVVMTVDDAAGEDLDPGSEGLVVVFNASPEATTQTVAGLAGRAYALHPVQAEGGDPVVRTASADPATGAFSVPARTVAVFVAP
jgi:pullulanase-type alpha-1,6-glucosidase